LDGFLGNAIACLLAIAIGAAVYGIVLLKIKGIDSDEIKGFPKGEKIWKLLRKIKLVK
jgi:stage V sporulation protein B